MKEFIEKLIGRLERNAFPLTYNFRTEKYLKFDKAKEIVKDLTEEYKGGWIPCSERMPREDKQYEVTVDKRRYGKPTVRETGYRYWDKGSWLSCDEVVAWKEKTAPYKEGCE